MKKGLSRVLLSLSFALLSAMGLGAQTVVRDTVVVYFNQGSTDIVPELKGNSEALESIVLAVKRYASVPEFHIYIKGWASPNGSSVFNKSLSEGRASSVLDYVSKQVSWTLPGSSYTLDGKGVDWDGLAENLASGKDFTGRDDVLRIIRDIPVWISDGKAVTGGRKKALMDYRGGRTFLYLTEHYFPQLQRAEVVMEYVPQDGGRSVSPVETVPAAVSDVAAPDDSIFISERPVPEYLPVYRMALKTNLLADAALMPSLELEWLITPSWSVSAQGAVAWWSIRPQHRYYQIATIYPEVRWWFSTREAWHGHYLGLFAGGSWYDLENGGRGYRGEGGFVGLSYGYMLPVGKRLSLEFGIGAGWLFTEYEEYLPVPYEEGTHYVYQQTSRMSCFAPLKLKLALVWRFGDWSDKNRK